MRVRSLGVKRSRPDTRLFKDDYHGRSATTSQNLATMVESSKVTQADPDHTGGNLGEKSREIDRAVLRERAATHLNKLVAQGNAGHRTRFDTITASTAAASREGGSLKDMIRGARANVLVHTRAEKVLEEADMLAVRTWNEQFGEPAVDHAIALYPRPRAHEGVPSSDP